MLDVTDENHIFVVIDKVNITLMKDYVGASIKLFLSKYSVSVFLQKQISRKLCKKDELTII